MNNELDIGEYCKSCGKYLPEVNEFGLCAYCYSSDDNVEEVDMVNNPPHYNFHESGVECIELTRWMSGNLAAAFKYVFRAEHKGNVLENYEKSLWYVKDEINRLHYVSRILSSGIPDDEYSMFLVKLGMVVGLERTVDRAKLLRNLGFAGLGLNHEPYLDYAKNSLERIISELEGIAIEKENYPTDVADETIVESLIEGIGEVEAAEEVKVKKTKKKRAVEIEESIEFCEE